MKCEISIIIPTLNEQISLRAMIENLNNLDGKFEIIVVDGGSLDDTISIAERCGAKVIKSERGRGKQLHAGAEIARSDILWFLHADTFPVNNTIAQMRRVLENPTVIGGNFTILFDGQTHAAKFMTWLYPKLRLIGLIYGDSGIFVRRDIYEKIGGFKPLPLFEDLDFVRSLHKEGEFVNLSATVLTSSRRFEGRSFFFMFLRWSILQMLFWIGFNPYLLSKFYLPIRSLKPKSHSKSS